MISSKGADAVLVINPLVLVTARDLKDKPLVRFCGLEKE